MIEKQLELFINTPADMVEEYQAVSGQEPSWQMYSNLIVEEMDEWVEAVDLRGPSDEELKELSDLIYVIYGYAYAKGWNLDEAIKRVHENNMGRMRQPDGTIKRREDGKIIKNKDYPKVDLGDLV